MSPPDILFWWLAASEADVETLLRSTGAIGGCPPFPEEAELQVEGVDEEEGGEQSTPFRSTGDGSCAAVVVVVVVVVVTGKRSGGVV